MAQANDWSLDKDAIARVRRLNLNLLYALHALLHARSLTAAAQMSAISQPAMSVKLRRLREHFEDELVLFGERHQLTALGEALQQRVSHLLREVDDTFNLTLRFDPATTRQTITVAAPEIIELMFISRLIPQLHEAAPHIHIRTVPFVHASVGQLFDAGADIAIVPETMADDRLSAQPLLSHRLTGLVWHNHPLVGRMVGEAAYLASRHVALHDHIEHAMFGAVDPSHLLARRDIVVRTGLNSMLPMLAIESDFVVTTSNWFAQYCAGFMPLSLLELDFPLPSSLLLAQWQAYRDQEPVIRWMLAELQRGVELIGKPFRKVMRP